MPNRVCWYQCLATRAIYYDRIHCMWCPPSADPSHGCTISGLLQLLTDDTHLGILIWLITDGTFQLPVDLLIGCDLFTGALVTQEAYVQALPTEDTTATICDKMGKLSGHHSHQQPISSHCSTNLVTTQYL